MDEFPSGRAYTITRGKKWMPCVSTASNVWELAKDGQFLRLHVRVRRLLESLLATWDRPILLGISWLSFQ